MSMTEEQFTILLDAVHGLATHMDEENAKIRAEMATKDDLAKIRAEMATKDFVDRKVDGTEARLMAAIHKTDDKVNRLVDVLEKKDVLTINDAHKVIVG